MCNSNSYETAIKSIKKEIQKVEIEVIKLNYASKKFKRRVFKFGRGVFGIREIPFFFSKLKTMSIAITTYIEFTTIARILSIGVAGIAITIGIIFTTVPVHRTRQLPTISPMPEIIKRIPENKNYLVIKTI